MSTACPGHPYAASTDAMISTVGLLNVLYIILSRLICMI